MIRCLAYVFNTCGVRIPILRKNLKDFQVVSCAMLWLQGVLQPGPCLPRARRRSTRRTKRYLWSHARSPRQLSLERALPLFVSTANSRLTSNSLKGAKTLSEPRYRQYCDAIQSINSANNCLQTSNPPAVTSTRRIVPHRSRKPIPSDWSVNWGHCLSTTGATPPVIFEIIHRYGNFQYAVILFYCFPDWSKFVDLIQVFADDPSIIVLDL